MPLLKKKSHFPVFLAGVNPVVTLSILASMLQKVTFADTFLINFPLQ